MSNHDVISAFLDGEPFDGQELTEALAQPGGRELLLDLVALTAVVGEADPDSASASATLAPAASPWRRLHLLAAAAALTVCVAGGYVWGASGTPTDSQGTVASKAPPEPTVVIRLEPGRDWTLEPRNPSGEGGH